MRWLSKGIDDFKVSPMLSLAYGALYAVVGILLIWLTQRNPIYAFGLVTIFYLAGPVIAVGLYCMSRQIEAGDKPSYGSFFKSMSYNPLGIVGFSIVMGMLIVFWTIVAAALFAVFFDGMTVSDGAIATIMANDQVLPFALVMMFVGLLFAVVSFSISVISIPLMTHKKVDVVTAMMTSMRAVKENPVVMLTWGFAIVALTGLGFAFAFIGVAVTLPIIGHASWHAYRELVVES
jgi:uncharacterized membrane protein